MSALVGKKQRDLRMANRRIPLLDALALLARAWREKPKIRQMPWIPVVKR
jgi:hypothetical protein